MTVTIKQMAEKIGVSVATVSRSMNPETRHKVAQSTLEKIDRILKQYSYTPNIAAKNLRKRTTKTIGVILPYFPGIFYSYYYLHILSGVSDFLLETDYQFKMLLLGQENDRWDKYDFKSGERVDGLVITHWFQFFSGKSVLDNMNIPCVVINDLEPDIQVQFVCADQSAGGAMVAEHLYTKGHRHFAIVSGPSWSRDSSLRIQGFRNYLKQMGIELNPDLIIDGQYHEKKTYDIADRLFDVDKKITAIFCCNDHMAYGVIRKLKSMKKLCPEHISIVGYDDDVQAASFVPPLTTVYVPVYQLGRIATQMLIDHLRKKTEEKLFGKTILPVQLIERASVTSLFSNI